MTEQEQVVIHGVDEDGRRMRPADWIERISSTLAQFGSDNRLVYSTSVKPCMIEGQKCLVVARCLEQSNPEAYAFIMEFARSNRLRIQMDRRHDERALGCAVAASA
jgi:hypothetical protein